MFVYINGTSLSDPEQKSLPFLLGNPGKRRTLGLVLRRRPTVEQSCGRNSSWYVQGSFREAWRMFRYVGAFLTVGWHSMNFMNTYHMTIIKLCLFVWLVSYYMFTVSQLKVWSYHDPTRCIQKTSSSWFIPPFLHETPWNRQEHSWVDSPKSPTFLLSLSVGEIFTQLNHLGTCFFL